MPFRYPGGDAKWIIVYISLEFKKKSRPVIELGSCQCIEMVVKARGLVISQGV